MIDCSNVRELSEDAARYLSIAQKDLVSLLIHGCIRALKVVYSTLKDENIIARFHRNTWKLEVRISKTIVQKVSDPVHELGAAEAKMIAPEKSIGDLIEIDVSNEISEALNKANALLFAEIEKEIKSVSKQIANTRLEEIRNRCVLAKIIEKRGSEVVLRLGELEFALPATEQIPGEQYEIDSEIVVFVKSIIELKHRNEVVVSRIDKELIAWALRKHIPEIDGGLIEIKGLSVLSSQGVLASLHSDLIDPVERAQKRSNAVQTELSNLPVIFVQWHDDEKAYIASIMGFAIKDIQTNKKSKKVKLFVSTDALDQNKQQLKDRCPFVESLTGLQVEYAQTDDKAGPKIGME